MGETTRLVRVLSINVTWVVAFLVPKVAVTVTEPLFAIAIKVADRLSFPKELLSELSHHANEVRSNLQLFA